MTTDQWRKLFIAYMKHVEQYKGRTFLYFEEDKLRLIMSAGLAEHASEIRETIEEGNEC